MVRDATFDDIAAMVALGQIMHAESRYSFMAYDGEKVASTLKTLMQTGGFVRVHERDGEIDGGMVGYMAEAWFSRARVAAELALFMRPDKRGGVAAWYLLSEFSAWAENQGAQEITLAITTGVKVEETGRMYQRLGFEQVGGVFKRRM
jgi:GNAT superfamily N-acetyltransferase